MKDSEHFWLLQKDYLDHSRSGIFGILAIFWANFIENQYFPWPQVANSRPLWPPVTISRPLCKCVGAVHHRNTYEICNTALFWHLWLFLDHYWKTWTFLGPTVFRSCSLGPKLTFKTKKERQTDWLTEPKSLTAKNLFSDPLDHSNMQFCDIWMNHIDLVALLDASKQ